MMTNQRQVSSFHLDAFRSQDAYADEHISSHTLFNLNAIQRKVSSMSSIQPTMVKDNIMDSGSTDLSLTSTFQSSDRHSEINAQTLSEQ